jgi:hypothetical protein
MLLLFWLIYGRNFLPAKIIYTNMKYLKRFNESVDEYNIEEIKQTIKDILLPISDMGYQINVTNYVDYGEEYLQIRVVGYTDASLKVSDEVKDEFIRMKDYLESLGINSVKALYVKQPTPSSQIEVDFDEFIGIDFSHYPLNSSKLRNLLFVAKI